jgi:hypothetical protein
LDLHRQSSAKVAAICSKDFLISNSFSKIGCMRWLLLLQSNPPGSFDTAIAIFFHLLFQKTLPACEIAIVVFVTFLNLRQAFGTIMQIATLLSTPFCRYDFHAEHFAALGIGVLQLVALLFDMGSLTIPEARRRFSSFLPHGILRCVASRR